MKEFIEKLIYRLDRELKPDNECFEYEDDYIYAEERHNKMLNIVKSLEKEYNNGWIPCSERLPDSLGRYIVTLKDGRSLEAIYDNISKRFIMYEHDVVAWMPMPQPYKITT